MGWGVLEGGRSAFHTVIGRLSPIITTMCSSSISARRPLVVKRGPGPERGPVALLSRSVSRVSLSEGVGGVGWATFTFPGAAFRSATWRANLSSNDSPASVVSVAWVMMRARGWGVAVGAGVWGGPMAAAVVSVVGVETPSFGFAYDLRVLGGTEAQPSASVARDGEGGGRLRWGGGVWRGICPTCTPSSPPGPGGRGCGVSCGLCSRQTRGGKVAPLGAAPASGVVAELTAYYTL